MSSVKRLILMVAGLLCVASGPALSSGPEAANWSQHIQEITLSNGMKFLVYSRGEAPIFSAYIRFRAGGLDEEPGATGLAHFLEHMAFKGTETIGTKDFASEKKVLDEIEKVGDQWAEEYRKGSSRDLKKLQVLKDRLKSLHEEQSRYLVREEFSKKVADNGGNDQNATTGKDMTSYFVSFPSEKLRVWAEMETARIFQPVFREFYEERDVVLEERRMRVDNDPDGRLYEALLKTAFQKSPYRWMTIGSEEDILGLTVGDLKKFWRTYYAPSNAVGALVGKLDVAETRKVLEETFGRVVFDGETLHRETPAEPSQTEERRVVLPLKASPRVWLAFHKPTLPEKDDYVFDVLDKILGDGRSSRLYRRLVLKDKLAVGIDTATSIPGSVLPNLFLVEVSIAPGKSAKDIVAAFDDERDRILKEGITERELEKAKNRLMMDSLWHLQTNEGLASQLSYFQILTGDWRYLRDYPMQIQKVSLEDLRKAVETYLVKSNRTVAEIEPKS